MTLVFLFRSWAARKVLTDVTSGIVQKASVFALLGDFILESQAVQRRKAVLWMLLSLTPRGSLFVSCKSSSFLPQ